LLARGLAALALEALATIMIPAFAAWLPLIRVVAVRAPLEI
jgi:hypothetical protein